MSPEMNNEVKITRCEEVAPLLVFYTCDELTASEREQIDAHLAKCGECRSQLKEEDALQAEIDRMPQAADQFDTSGVLLSQCRSELSEQLDELSAPKAEERWHPFAWARQWMALRPGWSAAALLLVGAIVGAQLYVWLPFSAPGGNGPAMSVLAAPKLTDDQLGKMQVSNVNFAPTGKIQLQVQAEQPITISSEDDDVDFGRVLRFVITNSDRFNAGIRIDCVEAMRNAANNDPQTRDALLIAARKDQNPAVRLKALEALRDLASMPAVRDVLLETLQQDPNPGVRVEAVNLLVRALESVNEAPDATETNEPEVVVSGAAPQTSPVTGKEAEQRILRALDELRQHDSNRYVRLRSAAALRQIAQQDLQ
jgi:HEAT repeats/Putative zinc-finger